MSENDYLTIMSTEVKTFDEIVKQHMDRGYKLYGDPFTCVLKGYTTFCQVVIKLKEIS